jgi:hypothetical protein
MKVTKSPCALFKILLAAAVLLGALAPTELLAVRGPQGVANTPHNLSSSSLEFMFQSNEDEICIFCHTPHGGSLDGPLWNKVLTTASFTHYASATLSTKVGTANRAVSNESLLCLTCHDGTVSMYQVINASNRTGAQPAPNWSGADYMLPLAPEDGIYGGYIGIDLADDHPISFLYEAVRSDALKPKNASSLREIGAAEALGVRFFPQNGAIGDKRVECSSCHDPHVDYQAWPDGPATGDERYRPFLITPNTGSALCLACHIK